uniref:Uncharacterized protein n=1 Tax=Rhizophora mucronata TaxID=61149 RepID=A0A2P2QHK7_RHIMU
MHARIYLFALVLVLNNVNHLITFSLGL